MRARPAHGRRSESTAAHRASPDTKRVGPSSGPRGQSSAYGPVTDDEVDGLANEHENGIVTPQWPATPEPESQPESQFRPFSYTPPFTCEVVIEQLDRRSWQTAIRSKGQSKKGQRSDAAKGSGSKKASCRSSTKSSARRDHTPDDEALDAITTPSPTGELQRHAQSGAKAFPDAYAQGSPTGRAAQGDAEDPIDLDPSSPAADLWPAQLDRDHDDECKDPSIANGPGQPNGAKDEDEATDHEEEGWHGIEPELKSEPEPELDPEPEPEPAEEQVDLEEEAMLEELRALLEADAAESESGDENETYEQKRQRKLRQNEALLAQLGLGAMDGSKGESIQDCRDSAKPEDEQSQLPQQQAEDHDGHEKQRQGSARPETGAGVDVSSHPAPKKRKKYERRIRYAEDGTTKDDPLPGMIFAVAYIEVPQIRERARNDYCFVEDVPEPIYEDPWSEPEEEEEEEEEVEEEEEDAAGKQGRAVSSKVEVGPKKKRGRPRKQPLETTGEPAAAAERPVKKKKIDPDAPGTTCHQCRRKTTDDKMHCSYSKGDLTCTLHFCKRCIEIRYGLDFDASSTTFKCPRCMGYCNCSICLRKSGHGRQLVETDPNLKRMVSLSRRIMDSEGKQRFGSVKEYIQALLGGEVKLQDESNIARGGRPSKSAVADGGESKAGTLAKRKTQKPKLPQLRYRATRLPDELGLPSLKIRFAPQRTRAFSVAELASNPAADQTSEPVATLPEATSHADDGAEADMNVEGDPGRPNTGRSRGRPRKQPATAQERQSPAARPSRRSTEVAERESNVWVRGAADVSSDESSDLSDEDEPPESYDATSAAATGDAEQPPYQTALLESSQMELDDPASRAPIGEALETRSMLSSALTEPTDDETNQLEGGIAIYQGMPGIQPMDIGGEQPVNQPGLGSVWRSSSTRLPPSALGQAFETNSDGLATMGPRFGEEANAPNLGFGVFGRDFATNGGSGHAIGDPYGRVGASRGEPFAAPLSMSFDQTMDIAAGPDPFEAPLHPSMLVERAPSHPVGSSASFAKAGGTAVSDASSEYRNLVHTEREVQSAESARRPFQPYPLHLMSGPQP
ncbi:hypothetical protein ACQY0O_007475 [Thecaphora frezii]